MTRLSVCILDKVGRWARGSLDLACALRNHLDVDVALRERAESRPVLVGSARQLVSKRFAMIFGAPEHLACDSDHVLHVLADQRQDSHVARDRNLYARQGIASARVRHFSP